MTEYEENAVRDFLLSSRLTLLGFVDDKLDEVRRRFKTLFEEVDKDVDSFYGSSSSLEILRSVNEISTLLQEINVISKNRRTFKRLERTKNT